MAQDASILFERYLALLGVERRAPSRDALFELVAENLLRIPFENISKLYHLRRYNQRRLPDLTRYLDGIEQFHFGGTCYANNYYMHLLLVHLGYDVTLCGADMANPDVHLVNLVRVGGREYLVDCGYAAPFLEPLPRDLDRDVVVELGRDRYVLRPADARGCSRLDLFRDGDRLHGYTVKPTTRSIEFFTSVIENSYRHSATFMNALLLVRFFRGRSVRLHNLTMEISEGTHCRIHTVSDPTELPTAIEEQFLIPAAIVSEAIVGLGELGNPWS